MKFSYSQEFSLLFWPIKEKNKLSHRSYTNTYPTTYKIVICFSTIILKSMNFFQKKLDKKKNMVYYNVIYFLI